MYVSEKLSDYQQVLKFSNDISFGLCKTAYTEYYNPTNTTQRVYDILLRVLGAIPLLGIAVGLSRMQQNSSGSPLYKRGIAECLGVGSLFLLADVIAELFFKMPLTCLKK